MSIIFKRHFKYKVKRTSEKWTAHIYIQEGLTPWYRHLYQVSADTEPEVVDKAEHWIKYNYSHYIWLEDWLSDVWNDIKRNFAKLKPWYFEGWPMVTWKKVKRYFKKLPHKFEILKDYEPYMDCGEKHIKWYNPIFVYISDVRYKWKYNMARFEGSPEVSVTFFKKWTLKWSWSISEADSLYWEDILEYLYNGRKLEDLGKHYLQIVGTPDRIAIDGYLNKENIIKDFEKIN